MIRQGENQENKKDKSSEVMEKLLKTYIDNNKLGKSTGEGFYKYK